MDAVVAQRTRHLTVVLEDIFQPHNASAVLRSCECFGIQDVHVVENEKEFRINEDISRGACKWLDLHRYQAKDSEKHNTVACAEALRAKGYRLAAATLRKGAVPLSEVSLEQPLAIMIGHERKGLSEVAHEEADVWFHLPIHGFTESYNLSVFGALCFYELTRRLHAAGDDWRLSEQEQLDLHLKWLRADTKNAERLIAEFLESRELVEKVDT